MKLVGKKLYRIGPLKLFKNGWGSVGNRGRGAEASRGMRSSGGGSSNVYQKSNADRIRRQQEAQAAAAAAAAAKERERIKEEKRARAEMKGVFEKKLTGAGPQAEARDVESQMIKRMSDPAYLANLRQKRTSEMLGARNLGRGGKKALQQSFAESHRRGQQDAMGASKDVSGMAGRMRTTDVGLAKADKTAAMKAQQLFMGEKLAREGMKAQIEAARAGARCFGGETKISTPSGQVYIKTLRQGMKS